MEATRKVNLENLANSLLKEWGLTKKGWVFVWGNKKRSFGTCRPSRKVIELHSFLLPTINDEAAEDTIRHEIAHALDFEQRGKSDHSYKWKAWAIKVGADPSRTKSHDNYEALVVKSNQSKYRLVCPNGHVFPSHRKEKKNKRSIACCVICHKDNKGYIKLKQEQNY